MRGADECPGAGEVVWRAAGDSVLGVAGGLLGTVSWGWPGLALGDRKLLIGSDRGACGASEDGLRALREGGDRGSLRRGNVEGMFYSTTCK